MRQRNEFIGEILNALRKKSGTLKDKRDALLALGELAKASLLFDEKDAAKILRLSLKSRQK